MPSRVRVVESRTVYSGRIIKVKVDSIIEPGGVEAVREVVCHPGSVVVLPFLDDGRVLLVRQFRYPAGQSLWELVAGRIESGETPCQAANRELQEEAGYRARSLKPLLKFYPSPGILTERMHLVAARGLGPAAAQPDADERIHVGRFTRAELREMLDAGRLRDGKTLVGVLWLLQSGHGA